MASYKVIQDIEAEDHILGPLTLKQFIYGLVAIFFLYISAVCISKHLDWLLIVFLPPAGLAGFLAFPFVKDQPTEIWALAKIRFLFMPRKRIWDQNTTKEQVVITAPKKIDHHYTNGLTQTEVKSRLQTLTEIIDSRGWAMKNIDPNTVSSIGLIKPPAESDRLISPLDMPKPVPDDDITPDDDIMDDFNNPLAQQFSQMIDESTRSHREQLMESLNTIRSQLDQSGHDDIIGTVGRQSNTPLNPLPSPNPTQPLPTSQPTEVVRAPKPETVPDNAILNLASNNDRNVASLAREAKQLRNSGDEVVVPLH